MVLKTLENIKNRPHGGWPCGIDEKDILLSTKNPQTHMEGRHLLTTMNL